MNEYKEIYHVQGLSLTLSPTIRQRHSTEPKQTLIAPNPPHAVCGRDGMRIADQVLKKYGVVGMLIGGLAKALWQGHTKDEQLSTHHDTDVLILSHDCNRHPVQHEEGVDWWVSHTRTERPTNGNDVGLVWRMWLDTHALRIPAGLYICPGDLLAESIAWERAMFRKNTVTGCRIRKQEPTLYPVLDSRQLRHDWAALTVKQADYCKHRV